MAKVSPQVRSFNAGEYSPLMEGRNDTNGYPASSRAMSNAVAAPQGPWIPRSGTEFINTVYKHDEESTLIPFVFSETDFYMMEFANSRVRFFTEQGVLVYTAVAMTVTDDSPFKFDSATLGADVGDEVALVGFPDTYNLNGVVGKIVGKVGTVYELDIPHPALPLLTAEVARVYHIVSPYASTVLDDIVDVPSLDVVYLFHPTIKTYKLQRSNTYSWAFTAVAWSDGPYLPVNETKTVLSVSATGKATPNMTNNTSPSGTASGSSVLAGLDYYLAFDDVKNTTYWQSNVEQSGIIQYQASSGYIADGYCIHMAVNNADINYTSKDYAPSNFTFEGSNDGSTWVILDKKNNYILYDNNKSLFFTIPNTTSYTYYRLNIESTTRNGAIKPAVKSLVIRSTTSTSLTLTASSVTGINNGQGFLSTDVGRLLRVQADDGAWRPMVISARSSTTQVTVTLLGEPFPNLNPTAKWRLGAWSDTTGYANTGCFFQDRLWAGGSTAFPDIIAASQTGLYENMAPTTEAGEVLATSGICVRLNARKLSRIKWLVGVKKGLAIGTGAQEFIASTTTSSEGARVLSPLPGGFVAEDCSARGSSDTIPVSIDTQVLYTQRSGRTLREFTYNYEADNYKSPSMSLLASHLGVSPFKQLAYAAEPYSIVWVRRAAGSIVGLTYNRDEDVVGWHRHNFENEVIKRIAVMPSSDQLQDTLWMIIERTVDGTQRRYIEKLTKFWDFGMTIEDAHYVDSGLRYTGDPITEVYGLQHLEAREVYGLADGIPVGPFTVTDGMIVLLQEASNIVIGLGFDSEGETSSLENGAQDGTAQGKEKRMMNFTAKVWDSYGGEIGTWNEDMNEVVYVPLADLYRSGNVDEIETITLFTGILGPFTPAPGYEKRGSVFFRRKKEEPLPFNIVALMPQMVTQDRG